MQDSDTSRKIEDVISALVLNVEQICLCKFHRDYNITNSAFQCFPDSPQAVTYRAVLHGTTSASSSKILRHIEQWISEGARISIQNVVINVDPSCVLVIDSVRDNECGATDQPTVVTSNDIGVAVGCAGAVVLILSLFIAIPIATVLLLKQRKRRTEERR